MTVHAACNSMRCMGHLMCRSLTGGEDVCPEIPREQMIMYKLHVRGFSMDSGTRSVPGTFRALMNRIPYLKKLGVTTVELMPVYEFEEIELPKQQKLPEYIRWKRKTDGSDPPGRKK